MSKRKSPEEIAEALTRGADYSGFLTRAIAAAIQAERDDADSRIVQLGVRYATIKNRKVRIRVWGRE